MCRRTASASRWWWTRGWSCAGPSSTGWTSPTSTTLSKGSQKTRRKAGKVKLSFSQKQPHFKEITSSHLWRQRNLDRRRTRVWSSSGGEILAYFIFNSRVLEFKTHATLTHLGSMQSIILDGLILFDLSTNIVRESKEGTNSLTHWVKGGSPPWDVLALEICSQDRLIAGVKCAWNDKEYFGK